MNALTDAAWNRLGIVAFGTAQAADSTSITLASSHAFASDELNGAVVYISGDTGVGQFPKHPRLRLGQGDCGYLDHDPGGDRHVLCGVCGPARVGGEPARGQSDAGGRLAAVNTATARRWREVVSMDTNVISGEAVSAAAVTKISSGLATSTEVSTGFAAQTAILSTMATAVLGVSTQVGAMSSNLSTVAAALAAATTFRARGRVELHH